MILRGVAREQTKTKQPLLSATHRKPLKEPAKQESTTKPASKKKNLETSKKPSKQEFEETKIIIGAEGGEDFDIDSLDPNCCNVDVKVTLFGVFQVGWTTVDVGSDTYQVYDYYSRAHFM